MKVKTTADKRVRFELVHRLSAAFAMLAFIVVLVAGIMAEARLTTIVFRAVGVIIAVSIITRVLIQILATYEEVNRGKT